MNLAIEYLARKPKLILPCSIYLFTPSWKKLVVTLEDHDQFLKVNHYKLWLAEPGLLPPFDSFEVEKENAFTDENIVLKDHAMLKYYENPYPVDIRQYTDPPRSLSQTQEYNQIMSMYSNSVGNLRNRQNWLWTSFYDVNVRKDNIHMIEAQMMTVNLYETEKWNLWKEWKSTMDFHNEIASEIVFKNCFPK